MIKIQPLEVMSAEIHTLKNWLAILKRIFKTFSYVFHTLSLRKEFSHLNYI